MERTDARHLQCDTIIGDAGTDAVCFIVAALVNRRSVPLVPRIEIRGWRNEVGLRRLDASG